MASPRMTDDEIWAFVSDAHTGVMTTLRRDGVPIALPLWFACVDRQVYAQTRGKKLQRIAHDSRSSFLVESGERWAELQAVHFTGTAEIIDVEGDLARQIRQEIERKYAAFTTPRAAMPKATGDHYATTMSAVVRFTPDTRVLSWDNRKLSS
jgi:nitroimidazol reductase NimA-like FMN-containing flavoprotein (pyridoxamine 5'-phosphate oxidase superfamily)